MRVSVGLCQDIYEEKWRLFNDNLVELVKNPEDYVNNRIEQDDRTPYILFYRKCGCRPDFRKPPTPQAETLLVVDDDDDNPNDSENNLCTQETNASTEDYECMTSSLSNTSTQTDSSLSTSTASTIESSSLDTGFLFRSHYRSLLYFLGLLNC